MKYKHIAGLHTHKYLFLMIAKPGLCFFLKTVNTYNIFPKNYNFLEKYMSLCYTTSRLTYGENT
ncbi:hypothetical protein DF217_03070 [Streptococcus oralis]|uniref:Uncharacterized protein n=1 Tax=Streptococcus oralis TaxID=1303 RepID=A0A4V1QC94_STROR|nr:hypothetical protein DF217_03070 [Streptococcus oralis]